MCMEREGKADYLEEILNIFDSPEHFTFINQPFSFAQIKIPLGKLSGSIFLI